MLLRSPTIHKRRSKRTAPQQARVGKNQRIQNEIGAQPAKPMRQPCWRSHGTLLLFNLDQAGAIIHVNIVKKPFVERSEYREAICSESSLPMETHRHYMKLRDHNS